MWSNIAFKVPKDFIGSEKVQISTPEILQKTYADFWELVFLMEGMERTAIFQITRESGESYPVVAYKASEECNLARFKKQVSIHYPNLNPIPWNTFSMEDFVESLPSILLYDEDEQWGFNGES